MKCVAAAALVAGLATVLVGCSASGRWMGAEAEKAYDNELDIRRLAETLNNEDYFEFEKEGRIYVLSDAKDYNTFLKTHEVVLSTKKIGGGPGGKTIVYGLIKNEAKLLEKNPKSQGAAQMMFEGQLKGIEKEFFGLVQRDEACYVFSSWKDLEAFKAGRPATGFSEPGACVEQRKVVYVGSAAKPESLAARFAKVHVK